MGIRNSRRYARVGGVNGGTMEARNKVGLLVGLGVGGGLMYLLDPGRGRRRRTFTRDKVGRIARQVVKTAEKTARDLANRTHGLAVEVRSRRAEERVADQVLEARVRTRLGRLVSNPHELQATAHEGVVTLNGPLLEQEAAALLTGVADIEGVSRIENRLKLYRHVWQASGLRNAGSRNGKHLLSGHWPPATRFLAGLGGSVLALSGMRVAGKRGALGAALALSGAGLLARGVTNQKFKRLVGMTSGTWEVDLRKTLYLRVPVEEAFEFWANYRNFPRFMAHVREVRDLGNGRSQWIAAGPAGTSVEWEAEVTRFEPNRLIAWQSVPTSMIETAGVVRFTNKNGGTRLDIRIGYNPPAGSVGPLVSKLLGGDPKRAMNADLQRLKSLLEAGKTTVNGEKITREELPATAKIATPAAQAT